MTPEFTYFLKVNVAFALFYAFYRLFFYKDTFFKLRRIILLAFFTLALLYPFLNIQEWVKEQQPIAEVIHIYSVMMLPEATVVSGQVAGIDWAGWLRMGLIGIYWIMVALLAVRFLVQLGSILWLQHTSKRIELQGIPIYALRKPAGPFSFFRLIFIYPGDHSEKELSEILTHECTHVLQWHSLDVVLSELITVFCWINPFVWLLKREVRHNLEYLADNTVIQAGYDSKSYQYHLLGLAHHHQADSQLYNSFNVLHLKNRISMMNKKRSCGIERTKYLIFLPLAALLMLFSNIEAVARITAALTRIPASPEPVIQMKPGAIQEPVKAVPASPEPIRENQPEITVTAVNPQDTMKSVNTPLSQVFTVVEEMPKYPGGDVALLKFIAQNVKYPPEAIAEGVAGRVICSFIVSQDGSIRDVEVMRGIDPRLDAEAIRVIGLMPLWEPGKQRGRAVDVKYTVPITFSLTGEKEEEQRSALNRDEEKTPDGNGIYRVVDEMPKFPGGEGALLKFIAKNINYPINEMKKGIQGRVILAFIIKDDGTVSDIEVLRGVSYELDKEAVRVAKKLPAWTPGKQDGKAVSVRYTIPISFHLSEPRTSIQTH